MNYIAHKEGDRIQTIKEHLEGTASLAQSFAEKFGKGEWGYCCGMLHDIGKYSEEFQQKISNDTDKRVDHSTAGAQLCDKKGGYYSVLRYCIAGHHAGIPDYGNTGLSSSLCGRLKKTIPDYQKYKEDIQIPELHTNPIVFDKEKNMDFSLSMFIRMLYSCLVDADFLDTENFMNAGCSERIAGESMEILLGKLEKHIEEWLKNADTDTVNGRRTEILKHCLKSGKNKKGMFRLTVPTGGGKTIDSLAFALKHAVENQMDRIIYVIPYTSIIEQNAQVFREILGEENVLENHCNVEYEGSEDFKPMQLASENWDKPVVVTTNVQFFESLFSNRSSKCRKLHNISNSVIIFDEAQMIPLDYLKPCMSAIESLVADYAASVVLCTATQPALDSFLSENNIKELCPRVQEQFSFFERVNFQRFGSISKEFLAAQLKQQDNVLCIVNTRKRAQELYELVQGEGVFHLSTNMYPKHRKQVLQNVRNHLKQKEKCILISTSLVEAGVDLDFDCVYRQISGIDSMIQAAGRCNREGLKKKEESTVYIFDFEDMKPVQNQKLQISTANAVLKDHEQISDLKSIQEYFLRLYHYRGASLDKKNIMDEFKNLQYNFAKVSKEFKLIEQETKTVFISREDEAKQLLKEITLKGMSREHIRKAGKYSVQIFKQEFDLLNDAGILCPVTEDMSDFYQLTAEEQYSDQMGLCLSVDRKDAFFF